jgi:hypothetical protein
MGCARLKVTVLDPIEVHKVSGSEPICSAVAVPPDATEAATGNVTGIGTLHHPCWATTETPVILPLDTTYVIFGRQLLQNTY